MPHNRPDYPSLNSKPGCIKIVDTFRGVSGFLVTGEAEAVTAVEQLSGLDRLAIRAHAEIFSAARMVDA